MNSDLLHNDMVTFGSIVVLLVGPNEWKRVFKRLGQVPVALKICIFGPLITYGK